jgi:hypothetical protein
MTSCHTFSSHLKDLAGEKRTGNTRASSLNAVVVCICDVAVRLVCGKQQAELFTVFSMVHLRQCSVLVHIRSNKT